MADNASSVANHAYDAILQTYNTKMPGHYFKSSMILVIVSESIFILVLQTSKIASAFTSKYWWGITPYHT